MKIKNVMKRIIPIFLLAVFVVAQGLSLTPLKAKAQEQFSVEVVVVGTQGVLAQGISNKSNAKEAADEILNSAGLQMELYTDKSMDGMIKKIGNLANSDDWSKYWYTAVNRNGRYAAVYDGIKTLQLQNKDRYLIYYCNPATQTANKIVYSTNIPGQKLTISLNNIGYTGAVTPITGINAKVDGNQVSLNNNGQIIFENGLAKGTHTLEISDFKTNPNEIPKVLADKFEFVLDPSVQNNAGTDIYNKDNRLIVKDINNEILNSSNYLKDISGDWAAVTLQKLSVKAKEDFIKNYAADISKNGIKDYSNTDLEKLIIALTACGYSPYSFENQNIAAELLNRNIDEFQVNDTIFGLLAYNYANISGDYKITKENLIKKLLSQKISYKDSDGFTDRSGWALSGKAANPDITAMAISALSPYYASQKEVKSAVDMAILTLSAMQNESGYILYNDGTATEVTSETISALIIALTSVGVDPEGPQFLNTKGDLVSALLSFKGSNGEFKHTLDGANDSIATEQALRALISLREFKTNGKYNFYSSNIDASKLPVFEYKVLPQTGYAIDLNMLAGVGILMLAAGILMIKRKSTKVN